MRASELRWRRTLRRIVISLLASPIAAAACHSSSDSDAPPAVDASASDGATLDATGGGPHPSMDAGATTDAWGPQCDPVEFDAAGIPDDAADGCASFRVFPCGLPPGTPLEGCYLALDTCANACGTNFLYYCTLAAGSCSDDAGVFSDAPAILDCVTCGSASGRRPRGLCAPRARARTAAPSLLGDYFASMAHLESASVRAFRDLEASLVALGAPRSLTRAAHRARIDEQRHTRVTARIARRFGGSPPRPRVRRVAAPSLATLLEDDVIEGCVGETFGALVATWQAATSQDPRIRKTMGRIAADETRHAALAWEILGWGLARLGKEDQRRVDQAFERALAALARKPVPTLDAAARRLAGLPSPADERRLARELGRALRQGRDCVVMRERPAEGGPLK